MPSQIQLHVPKIGSLEDTVMWLRDEMSRNSEWTERIIGIHERKHRRQMPLYSSIMGLAPSP